MTKKEAESKWCPIMHGAGGGKSCIASDCMMWRWSEHVQVERRIQDEHPSGEKWKDTGRFAEVDKRNEKLKIWERSFPEERWGYCGLAGKP